MHSLHSVKTALTIFTLGNELPFMTSSKSQYFKKISAQHSSENKDHLYHASLTVNDPVLLVGSDWYLAISPQQIAGGSAVKSEGHFLHWLPSN